VRDLLPFEPFDWLREAVKDELDPGEQLAAMCEFTHWESDDAGRPVSDESLLVLTNRNLRFMAFQSRHRRGTFERGPCTFNAMVPLNEIHGLSVTRTPPGVLRRAETGVEVRWRGGVETWGSPYVEGDHLVRLLEDHLARKNASNFAGGLSDEIGRLAVLAQEGIISQDEFERGKELFLGKAPDARDDAMTLLRQLHGLYKSGVLSESEFNMKKWDVLSRH
jgi:hypothetical protein